MKRLITLFILLVSSVCFAGSQQFYYGSSGGTGDTSVGGNTANTVLLTSLDRGDQSGKNLTIVADSGGLTIDATTDDNDSFSFDGTNDRVTTPDHASLDIPTTRTIELIVKHTDHVGTETYIAQYEDANNSWGFRNVSGTGLQFNIESGGNDSFVKISGAEIADTSWHHIAVTKSGSDYVLYKDGVSIATLTDGNIDTFAGPLNIAALAAGAEVFSGNIKFARIIDSLVYTGAFTPNMSPSCAGTEVFCIDASKLADRAVGASIPHDLTLYNNIVLSPIPADGDTDFVGSLLSGATGIKATYPDNVDYTFGAGDFTIQLWFKRADSNNNVTLLGKATDPTYAWRMYLNNDNKLVFYVNNFAADVTSSTVFTDTNWHHVAVSVVGNSLMSLYIDGSVQSNHSMSGITVADDSGVLYLYDWVYGAANEQFYGYIDELKIDKGTAYTFSNDSESDYYYKKSGPFTP